MGVSSSRMMARSSIQHIRDHAAQDAWERLYEHVTSTIRTARADRDPRSLNAAVGDLRSPSPACRHTALVDIHNAVAPHAEVLARCVDHEGAQRLGVGVARDAHRCAAGWWW